MVSDDDVFQEVIENEDLDEAIGLAVRWRCRAERAEGKLEGLAEVLTYFKGRVAELERLMFREPLSERLLRELMEEDEPAPAAPA